jgi:beta-galactosidase
VRAYSNLAEVELLVNGKSVGRQKVPRLGHVEWKVRYEAGAIEARGFKDGKLALTDKRETVGAAATIRLTADRKEINADGEDVAVLRVEALDSKSRLVPIAQNMIRFKVSGEGALIGVGNGNPNCQESDKEPMRSLFNGLAQVIVQSTKNAGAIEITAASPGLASAQLTIATKQVQLRPSL